MPVANRSPEDAQPLARPVADQPLARPVGTEQEEARGTEGATQTEEQTSHPEAVEKEKGPVEKALDKAQENGWVYDSVADQAREKGLASKVDEIVSKARNKLAGG